MALMEKPTAVASLTEVVSASSSTFSPLIDSPCPPFAIALVRLALTDRDSDSSVRRSRSSLAGVHLVLYLI